MGKNKPSGLTDEAFLATYNAWGQREAARRLGLSQSAVGSRISRIKKRGCTRAEADAKKRAEADAKAADVQRVIEESQKKLLADSGTRANPPKYRGGNSIQELLDNHAIAAENVRLGKQRIKTWAGSVINRKTGLPEDKVYYSVGTTLEPHRPKFPLVGPAALPPKIVHAPAPRILRKVRSVVFLSDAQIWLLRNLQTGALIPVHDPCAMEVARCFVADIAPTKLVGIGDWCDWTVFSRYTKYPEFSTLRESVQLAFEWKAAFVAAAPKGCTHIEIASNHQLRPEKFVLEYNREALDLVRAQKPGETGEQWPVFSEAYLLNYDDLGIDFSGAYPGGEREILPNLVAMHAPDSKKYRFHCDVIHGHDHHMTTESYAHYDEKKRRFAWKRYSIGCLCSTGRNPNMRSIHPALVPAFSPRNDWALGFGIVEYIEGKLPRHQVHLVQIDEHVDGSRSALYAGQSHRVSLKGK